MEIKFALRDERINIFAMTYGNIKYNCPKQIILCKKSAIPQNRYGPFLLDCKLSSPDFTLSNIGKNYMNKITNIKFPLYYIAYIDCQIKVSINYKLFELLSTEGYFSIWDPIAPMKYFKGYSEGFLVVFKIYKIKDEINERLLEKGRHGRNFYYGLEKPINSEITEPVINDKEFELLRNNLLGVLKKNQYFLGIEYSDYFVPFNNRKDEEELLQDEMEIEVSNKNISLEKIADKIKSKFIRKRLITIETKQYYRDPDISSYAKKRANGKCDCCGRLAPFNRDDGTPFLETHHLIPLSEGGNDSIDNVCALCPNCHRMLHYGKNILEITQIIKNKLIY